MADKKMVIEGSKNVSASQVSDLFRQIGEKGITGKNLQDFLERRNPFSGPSRYLERVLCDQTIIIPECDGSSLIVDAAEVFTGGVDQSFNELYDKIPESDTKATYVGLYHLKKKANLSQVFISFGVDLDKLCFTQHQIKQFCVSFSALLNTNGPNCFLFKNRDQFFVAEVFVSSHSKLQIRLDYFGSHYVWRLGAISLVVPDLFVE